uniref:Uncharacterized protein LOC105042222 n=1 Tax=Elaeis guineensis var. tenera TaxID=51953 RepID=A0A6I9R4G6_ELAGV|nr:uncharacterized protein LOC105042222 [Elaeis guineensis]
MALGDIQDFYRQRKKGDATSSTAKKKSDKPQHNSAIVGADAAQTPFLVFHGSSDLQDDYGPEEEMLRQFDMNMKYGFGLGLTCLQRWGACLYHGPPPTTWELATPPSSSMWVATARPAQSIET